MSVWMKTQQWVSEQIKISWHKKKHSVLNRVVCLESRLWLKQNVLADAWRKFWHFHTVICCTRLLPFKPVTNHCNRHLWVWLHKYKYSVSDHCPRLLWMSIKGKYPKDAWKKNYMYDYKVALLPQLGLVNDASSACKPWLSCKLRSSKLQQQEDKLHIVQM